jgi:hypothetical protein
MVEEEQRRRVALSHDENYRDFRDAEEMFASAADIEGNG